MNPALRPHSAHSLAALRRLVAARPRSERCELCAAPVPEEHPHLVDPERRRLLCACQACAILFDHSGPARYRRVPREVRALEGLVIGDGLWNSLAIPIGLVFFFRSSVSTGTLAVYPSPAGPTETLVEADLWSELAALHPALAAMREDIEALLVNRIAGARDSYLVPIDECYKLTGIVRRDWSGFSGGEDVWEGIRRFFAGLQQRARAERSAGNA